MLIQYYNNMKRKLFKLKAELSHWIFDNMENYKLCFIRNNIAYFTTQPLDKQCGPLWDVDAKYNTIGVPELPKTRQNKWGSFGKPAWGILKLSWESNFKHICPPAEKEFVVINHINLEHTMPWLKGDDFEIYAGTTVKDFVEFLLRNETKNILPDIY